MSIDIRKMIEDKEAATLSQYAVLSINSEGRTVEEPLDDIRTCFAVDRDRILYSKAFRRLKGKTQVFINPVNDHYMNRLTHTLEVAQVARAIAVALNLNETLAEAIAYAHDLAHVAFAHPGEEALNIINEHRGGYSHESNVLRRIEHLEKHNGRRGLNLSLEVLDGALNHSGFSNAPKAKTKEGKIIPFADKIAYLGSDLENAISAGIITGIPRHLRLELGDTKGHMMDTMIKDIIFTSMDGPNICMSNHMFEVVSEFRNYMFKEVYFSKVCRREADKAIRIITELFKFLMENPEEVPAGYDDSSLEQNITDYIASMTDIYCLNMYKKYFFV